MPILTWEKVPSVRYGGKPYFYVSFREDNGRRVKYTVVWDHNARGWTTEVDNYRDFPIELACFNSSYDAKYEAENHASTEILRG